MAEPLTLACVATEPAFIVRAPAAIVPLVVSYPVPLRVIDWPGTAVAGVTVIERNPIVKSKAASLVVRLMFTLWTPSPMEAGILNLNGTRAAVLPEVGIAVIPGEVAFSAAVAPIVTLVAPTMVSPGSKSTKSTVTVDPGFELVDRGVAPAFCVNTVVLTSLIPLLSVTQTYPPALVPEPRVIVPEKTPVESIVPDPLNATPPAPVVGGVVACGFNRILQSSQLVLNPPPVTVNVAPRAAVVGLNFVNAVIADNVEVIAVVSVDDFTVNVPVVLLAVCAACLTFGLTIPAACVNVITTSAPTVAELAAIPSSPVLAVLSMSGTVMVTARPSTVTSEALFNRPAVPDPPVITEAFNLTAEAAIDDGTVNFEPNVTVSVPPTGIADIPAPPVAPVTVIVY
jgi:hypothetical protein